MRVFVTATGTEVGKTHVLCSLIRELRATSRRLRVIKPVVTGFDAVAVEHSDPGRLLAAQSLPPTPANLEAVSPWRYAAPLAPDMAARLEHRTLPFDELVAFCRMRVDADYALIEGIGGVMVPLDGSHTVLDWIAELTPRVLLVAGSYLGTLSHILTAVECLRARSVPPAAVVVCESETQPTAFFETLACAQRHLTDTPIIAFPRAPAPPPPLLPLLERPFAPPAGN